MISAAHPRTRWLASLKRGWMDDCASQIVELALSLPLLVFFVVGIFDFSGALTLKQKLTNAAREGARVSAADPASDMYATVPVSVSDAAQVVDNYLYSEKINDCGLGPTLPAPTPGANPLIWIYSATGSGCPGNGISIEINRGCWTLENGVYLIGTCVKVTYAYKWQFNSVSGLMPGKFLGPATITTTAEAFNEN